MGALRCWNCWWWSSASVCWRLTWVRAISRSWASPSAIPPRPRSKAWARRWTLTGSTTVITRAHNRGSEPWWCIPQTSPCGAAPICKRGGRRTPVVGLISIDPLGSHGILTCPPWARTGRSGVMVTGKMLRTAEMTDIHGAALRLRLKVQGLDGGIEVLEFVDSTPALALRHAAARGMRVLAIESGVTGAETVDGTAVAGSFPLLSFSQELLALLDAGLNLTEAIGTLLAKERNQGVRAVLAEVLRALREGRNFSDVLAGMAQHFPPVYIATVRASERTGDMPQSLARYIAYQIQFEAIRKKLVSAAIYPAMLLLVGGFVTLFLLGYVVPRFALVYESSGRDMPWLSALLLSFGRLIHGHWQRALTGLLSALGVGAWGLSRSQGRAWLLAQLLELPGLAPKANAFRLARVYRAVSLLLAAGIALPRAMGMVAGLLSPPQKKELVQCRLAVEQGQSLSAALVRTALASPVAESLIKVGERSGQMAEMLERTARFVDDDFARWVDWASRLLEPVLMLAIGLVIGAVVVLMYMPIFELAGSLQ